MPKNWGHYRAPLNAAIGDEAFDDLLLKALGQDNVAFYRRGGKQLPMKKVRKDGDWRFGKFNRIAHVANGNKNSGGTAKPGKAYDTMGQSSLGLMALEHGKATGNPDYLNLGHALLGVVTDPVRKGGLRQGGGWYGTKGILNKHTTTARDLATAADIDPRYMRYANKGARNLYSSLGDFIPKKRNDPLNYRIENGKINNRGEAKNWGYQNLVMRSIPPLFQMTGAPTGKLKDEARWLTKSYDKNQGKVGDLAPDMIDWWRRI